MADVKYEANLTPYTADELPQYLNSELRKIASAINEIQDLITALDERVTALETP